MTPTNDAPVTVTVKQCDRIAAARAVECVTDSPPKARPGFADLWEDDLAEAFAKHRLAALTSAPAGDGVEDRYSAGYSQGTIDADQQHQWMQDKAWQDAVLILVHYSTLAERTWLVGHEEAARKLAEWWAHARALADTKSADDIAALARPRAAVAIDADMLGEVMQDAWGEICDDAGAHPSDMKHGRGSVLFYSPNHWTRLIAMRLSERLALQSPPAKVEG